MSKDALADYRPTGRLGREFRYLARVGSTNDLALAAGREGAREGLLLVADEQTAGRGRMQRRWLSPPGSGLLTSLLFRPPEPFAHYAPRVTMLCGLAWVEAAREVSGVGALLKWPNDLIVSYPGTRRVVPAGPVLWWGKLGGMLSEVGMEGGRPTFLVVGTGINVNVPAAELPNLDRRATSLSHESGVPVSRVALLGRFLAHAERHYGALLAGEDPLPAWREHLAWVGEPVTVSAPQGEVLGIVKGVDADGALLLQDEAGEVHRFTAGDISLRPQYRTRHT